jgi:hypothetical protein
MYTYHAYFLPGIQITIRVIESTFKHKGNMASYSTQEEQCNTGENNILTPKMSKRRIVQAKPKPTFQKLKSIAVPEV